MQNRVLFRINILTRRMINFAAPVALLSLVACNGQTDANEFSIDSEHVASINVHPTPIETGNPRGIVGGSRAELGQIPWQVYLDIRQGRSSFLCGGIILDEYNILTAAHCVVSKKGKRTKARNIRVRYDGITLSAMKSVRVEAVIPEQRYNKNTLEHDIALLHLKRPLTLAETEYASMIELPRVPRTQPADNSNLLVSGFGSIAENGRTSKKLLYARVSSISRDRCLKDTLYPEIYGPSFLKSGMMCAGEMDGRKDSCTGDSGGPLVLVGTNQLVGIVSWGQGCARARLPGIYTNVSHYIGWINAHRKK